MNDRRNPLKNGFTWLRVFEAAAIILGLVGMTLLSNSRLDAAASELRSVDTVIIGDVTLLKQDFSTHAERDIFIQRDLAEIKADIKKLLGQ